MPQNNPCGHRIEASEPQIPSRLSRTIASLCAGHYTRRACALDWPGEPDTDTGRANMPYTADLEPVAFVPLARL